MFLDRLLGAMVTTVWLPRNPRMSINPPGVAIYLILLWAIYLILLWRRVQRMESRLLLVATN
jgi:hypothetical protein